MTLESTNIMDNAVILILTQHSVGTSRKVDPNEIDVDADKDLIRLSKTILDCAQAEAIRQYDRSVKSWVKSRCTKSPFAKGGVFVLSLGVYEEVDDYLRAAKPKREQLVKQLVEVVPQIKEKDEQRLKSLFDPDDYPSISKIREAYSMEWDYVSFKAPDVLKKVSRKAFDEAQAAEVRRTRQAGDIARTALRVGFATMVDHAVELFTGKTDGKKKRIHPKFLPKWNEFLALLPKKDITGDTELEELGVKATQLLEGIDPKDLAKSENVRDYVLDGFKKLQGSLDGMAVDRPKRIIHLESESHNSVDSANKPEPQACSAF